jgi:hypothetical protein
MIALAVVLMVAPDAWFGPTWSYFQGIPHNGFWMGVCLFALGGLQAVALRCNRAGQLAFFLFLGGFTFWTAGVTIAVGGLMGGQGLMEAPFMMYVGAHQFVYSAVLSSDRRSPPKRRRRRAR